MSLSLPVAVPRVGAGGGAGSGERGARLGYTPCPCCATSRARPFSHRIVKARHTRSTPRDVQVDLSLIHISEPTRRTPI
eukprot:3089913-Pleurochrysis_carterae.AAC.1